MTKPSDMQRLVLISACQHASGIAVKPTNLKGAQAAKVLAALVNNGLAKEIYAKHDMPIWRQDEQGRAIAVKILTAGRKAVASSKQTDDVNPTETTSDSDVVDGTTVGAAQPTSLKIGVGSKRAVVIGLMRREEGATIADLIAATDWLPHTTRAALSGLRKGGLSIERSKVERGGGSVYKIAASTAA